MSKLEFFRSLFKGREDVFAIHWKKGKKSGYMPAYQFDPYMYRLHKMNGGTFSEYKDKTYLPLNDNEIQKHLDGKQLMGIYPLLEDNTSWFIAADFDKEKWSEECQSLLNICLDLGIPAYLERSRSGKGGHVWIFFDKPYPAIRSRKILTSLLERAGVFSIFDKGSSFDRLFPNQDFHSGKGLGNLIALPLYKPALEKGNSCFVNEHLEPYSDQWNLLSAIERASIPHLDEIFNQIQSNTVSTHNANHKQNFESNKPHITLKEKIFLNRSGLTPTLITYLKNELNFANSEFFIKKQTGRNTWGTDRYFSFIQESENEVIIPRGFIGKLVRYCKEQNIAFDFHDKRIKHTPITFITSFNLREHQKTTIEACARKDFGVISSPPGSGKTVIGLKIIAEKQQPALIIVHRKQIFEQWIERIQAFLGIPKGEIGRIGQGKVKVGKAITVAMIQSLGKHFEKQETSKFAQSFGTIIIDECHHIPANTFRDTISKLSPYYQYGLTATPFRKGNDEKIIFIHLGEIIADINPTEIEQYKRPRIVVTDTELDVPYNPKTDPFETLSKVLIHDTSRNKLILEDIYTELNKGKKVIIITERKDHIETLYQFLKHSFEVITLSGDDSESSRNSKWQILENGNFQALITTGQFFGEGTDLHNATCLFLVYPFSFKGKLIQYIGRVQRSEITPTIYDYRDRKIEYLDRMFLKRNTYYRHFDKQATLFGDSEIETVPDTKTLTIDKKIKIPIDQLSFLYGAILAIHRVPELNKELEFEIENESVRPEFDVLKPYFSTVLKSKSVEIEIFAEFENQVLVCQRAASIDLEKINSEIIESVKFRYIDHSIIGKQYKSGSENKLLDLEGLQDGKDNNLIYNTEEDLLDDILKNETIKHYRQLRYLSTKHVADLMKLRFVLNPFSFVFLLSGHDQYHFVWETLDTEEATYIWHFKKDKQLIPEMVETINRDLGMIRSEGRQTFLEKPPEDFSRLIHDYSDQRKGFVIWKDRLEEKLL